MNFWKWFRWISTALFIVLLLVCLLLSNLRFDRSDRAVDAPRPAPLIVH